MRAEIATVTARVTEIDDQIGEMTAELTRLDGRLADLAPSLNDFVLNAPLLDFMAPTLKIQQVITPDIVDDVNFIEVPKLDRCMTCHLAIDRQGYEEYPQPFRTHSNLDVYVGSASPHPLEQTGCTVCHEGMGQSVTFRDAAHSPIDEAQLERWGGGTWLGGAAPLELPNASAGHDRSVMRQVSQGGDLRAGSERAQYGLRDV